MKKSSPKIDVHVHACHIERAKTCDAQECMIAQAIKDGHPYQRVRVDTQTIRFTDPATNRRYTYLTPPVAQKNIVAFDEKRPVGYFNFTLKAAVKIEKVKRQGGPTKPGPQPHRTPAKRRSVASKTRIRGVCLTT